MVMGKKVSFHSFLEKMCKMYYISLCLEFWCVEYQHR